MTDWRGPRHKPQDAFAFEGDVKVAKHRFLQSGNGLFRCIALRKQIEVNAFRDEAGLAPVQEATECYVFAAVSARENRRRD
jgi:hypothetical protein